MTDITCRGSYLLGTACGRCSRCEAERLTMAKNKTAKRPGPPCHGSEPKKKVNMALDTNLIAYLRAERERTGLPVSQLVERAIRLLQQSQPT